MSSTYAILKTWKHAPLQLWGIPTKYVKNNNRYNYLPTRDVYRYNKVPVRLYVLWGRS